MDRERERERVGARSDAASLWIDFLLLPPKLEEHLAAGPAAIPTPPDLISMFLEQALLNQKALNGGSSGNIASKDAETQGSIKVASKTASVLCERAARVAVVAQMTLSEIELSLASQQHQFVLLKTLIKHDEGRSLLHQCNLHRWLLHKALQCHPVGSAAPNAASPTPRLGYWTAGDDLGEVFHNIVNGNGDTSLFCGAGESRIEEERPSLEFLEQVLKNEDFIEQVVQVEEGVPIQVSAKSRTKSNSPQSCENGGSAKEQLLSTACKCQVLFDVAEVHFMRGRIRQAYEFFNRCRESLTFLSSREGTPGKQVGEDNSLTSMTTSSTNSSHQEMPVPEDRLAGFIVACRMLLSGASLSESATLTKTAAEVSLNVSTFNELDPSFGAPSIEQLSVITCEKSRWMSRSYSRVDSPHSGPGSDGVVCREALPKRENSEVTRDEGVYANNGVRMSDDGASYRQNKRSRSSKYTGDLNGNSGPKDFDVENVQTLRNETEVQAKRHHGLKPDPQELQRGGDSGVAVKENFTNGSDTDAHETKTLQVNGTKTEQTAAHGKEERFAIDSSNSQMKQFVSREKEQVMSDAGYGAQFRLIVDLEGESAEDSQYDPNNVVKATDTERRSTQGLLSQNFCEDVLRGHLSWAYCLSVEKDSTLSKLDRLKVAACNVVRSVLEGASVEIFLRISDQLEDSRDAVGFLMRLLQAIKVVEEGNLSPSTGSYAVDCRIKERLNKLGFFKQVQIAQGSGETSSLVLQRVHDLAMYVCSVIDEPWCWECAVKHRLARKTDLPMFTSPIPSHCFKPLKTSVTFVNTASASNGYIESGSKKMEEMKLMSQSDILMCLLQLEDLTDIEAFVERIRSEGRGATSKEVSTDVEQGSPKLISEKKLVDTVSTHERSLFPPPQPKTHSQPTGSHQVQDTNSGLMLTDDEIRSVSTPYTVDNVPHFEDDVATVLKRQAFTVVEVSRETQAATRFYELSLGLVPDDIDSCMMLWLLERTADTEGRSEALSQGRSLPASSQWSRSLPMKSERALLPSSELLDFAILFLIEKELWHFLSELCKWVLSLMKETTSRESELNTKSGSDSGTGGPETNGTRSESSTKTATVLGQQKHRRLLQTVKLGTILSDLLPLCISLQAEASRNHFNEDVARLGSKLSQLFEDFMCLLIGVETDGQSQGSDHAPDWRATHSGLNLPPLYTGAAGAPLISKVANPRALMALASLTAGWLHRCHVAGLSTWPLAVERYGVLAGVTAGAALPPPPGSLPYSTSVLRPVPPRVPPDCGRDLFGVLLEAIVSIPGVVEGDREKGHRWLQGLADLAFEDEAHVRALRLYLQAGAVRSAHYCDRSSSMCRDIFTRWVRMVAACRAIGAGVQAAVLCQCPNTPEHETAFRILQENTLIVDRDASAYFECLWEVPILELLVNMHAKAGDEARVNILIGLLQQPALNVHNPPAIRQAHISTMEQRFLQRFAGELLD
ncbi:hypothetical protein Mapa_004776 [Marchantia paleacea]|nr:hypothetical protein Mapa_004776 [Marchantia paleacea]